MNWHEKDESVGRRREARGGSVLFAVVFVLIVATIMSLELVKLNYP